VLEPGVYSIHLSAFDKAGNEKTGRGLFFYDDQSVVTLHGDPIKCQTASKNTSYKWVVQDTNTVQIIWPERFYNFRHKMWYLLNCLDSVVFLFALLNTIITMHVFDFYICSVSV
jgi:hypothetical protein